MAKLRNKSIGAWAFLIGVLLALVIGIFNSMIPTNIQGIIISLLVIAGILVGLLNIAGRESSGFLLAGVSLVIVSSLGQSAMANIGNIPWVGSFVSNTLTALTVLFVPTTIIVALKSVFGLARD